MAQQFIKIFDDTVLKQSVNQGYETQRTNTRLGKFTMGELAFTRDTARLFVGNFTPLNLEKDSGEVTGGSIVGNKYLGMIDSKPLTHFSEADTSKDTCVFLPLPYEHDITISRKTVDENENTITKSYTEKGLLLKDSKFRTDKNDGWLKEATYNDKYDAYNGDYMYDVYSNAIILFDKNIKPIPSTEPANWVYENYEQKFLNENQDFYSEEGNKANYSTQRTRIHNVESLASGTKDLTIPGNVNYPIYGDGYVMMRILEPDGITLGYKEKQFSTSDGRPKDNNYSHNYIEIKSVPTEKIKDCFDPQFFTIDGDNRYITFTGIFDEISVNKIKTQENNTLQMPSVIHFSDDIQPVTIRFVGNSLNEGIMTLINRGEMYETDIKSFTNLEIKFGKQTHRVILAPGSTQFIDLDLPITDSEEFKRVADPFYLLQDIATSGDLTYSGNSIYDGDGKLKATEEIPGLALKIENTPENQFNSSSEDAYSGFILYDSSGSKSTWKIQEESNDTNEETQTLFVGNFEHPYLSTGYNFLKDPEIIAWGTQTGYAQFYLNPYVVSPVGFNDGIGTIGSSPSSKSIDLNNSWEKTTKYTINQDGSYSEEEIINDKIGQWHTDNLYWTEERLIENTLEDGTIVYSIEETSHILENLLDGQTIGTRIPDHASSIVCEVHYMPDTETSKCLLVTNSDLSTISKNPPASADFKIFSDISASSLPTQLESPSTKHKVVFQSLPYSNIPSNVCQQIEFPLYRDKNGMKFFNFHITLNDASFVIRAIGYRA